MRSLKRWDWWVAGGLLLVALLWRLSHLMRVEVWYDEAYSMMATAGDWHFTWRIIVMQAQPPLHYLVLKLWSVFAGSSMQALRVEPVLWGSLLPPIIFLWLAKIVPNRGRIIGLATAVCLLINPFLVQYSREVRPYTQSTFLAVLAGILVYNSIIERRSDLKRWLVIGTIIALGWLTHYAVVFTVVPMVVWISAVTTDWLKEDRRKVAVGLAAPTLLGLTIFIQPIVTSFLIGGRFISWVPPIRYDYIQTTLWSFLVGVGRHTPGYTPALYGDKTAWSLCIVGALVLIGIWLLRRQVGKERTAPSWSIYTFWLWVGTLVMAALVSIGATPLWLPRYVMVAGVWFLVWLITLLAQAAVKSWPWGLLLVAVVAVGFIGREPVDFRFVDSVASAQKQPGVYTVHSAYDITMSCFFLDPLAVVQLFDGSSACRKGDVVFQYTSN